MRISGTGTGSDSSLVFVMPVPGRRSSSSCLGSLMQTKKRESGENDMDVVTQSEPLDTRPSCTLSPPASAHHKDTDPASSPIAIQLRAPLLCHSQDIDADQLISDLGK